jgi:GxxExxY protein
MLAEERTTEAIIGAAIEVHKTLGPGLLEAVYEECLCHELHLRGLSFQRQLDLPIAYKSVTLQSGLRLDLVVADAVVVEVKAVADLLPIHEAQLMTYLRLSGRKVGLLINFGAQFLKDGIVRRVL